MSELPPGWSKATIADLLADGLFVDGDWVESKDQDENGDVRLTQLADVGDGVWRDRSNRFMTSVKAKELGCTVLEPGDVLIARMPDPLGRACLFPGDDKPAVTVVDVAIARPGRTGVDPRWLMYFLNAPSTRLGISAYEAGSTRKRVSRKNLEKIEVPVPPLEEQKRIVERLDTALSLLDANEAALKRTTKRITSARRSLLRAAAAGSLVPQDSSEESAPTLLARGGWASAEDTENVPAGWADASLGDVLERIEAGKSFRAEGRPAKADEVGVIKVSAMTWGAFKPTENKVLPADVEINDRWRIHKGDLLVSRANTSAYVGASVLVGQDHPNLVLSDKSLRLVPLGWVNVRWLHLALSSPAARAQISAAATGTKESMRNISQAKLRAVRLLVPPPSEQERIVAAFDRYESVIAAAAASLQAADGKSRALRSSVLKAAFEGSLEPQDPSDEPAKMLLDRVKASRPATNGRSTKKSKAKVQA